MSGGRQHTGRALALFAALFAVTLNVLQPMLHAALMRDGASGTVWSAPCKAAAADPDGAPASTPSDLARAHDCCLGLADTVLLAAPSSAFVVRPPVVATLAASLPHETASSVGIRDGPCRPRGPPSIV